MLLVCLACTAGLALHACAMHSWHACLVGKYLFEGLARLPCCVEYASEFRYRDPVLFPGADVLIVLSQSGETADTLAAVNLAKSVGVAVVGVCNSVGSTIARETDGGVYLHAGPEIGVASTKAFTAQVAVLSMIALKLAKCKTPDAPQLARMSKELLELPKLIEEWLSNSSQKIASLATQFKYAQNFLFLGRGINFPVALEGALKMKEISYIHAEGYPAAEMKHGPIALIDEHMPVVVFPSAYAASRENDLYRIMWK